MIGAVQINAVSGLWFVPLVRPAAGMGAFAEFRASRRRCGEFPRTVRALNAVAGTPIKPLGFISGRVQIASNCRKWAAERASRMTREGGDYGVRFRIGLRTMARVGRGTTA
jgi:hypothetical protein